MLNQVGLCIRIQEAHNGSELYFGRCLVLYTVTSVNGNRAYKSAVSSIPISTAKTSKSDIGKNPAQEPR